MSLEEQFKNPNKNFEHTQKISGRDFLLSIGKIEGEDNIAHYIGNDSVVNYLEQEFLKNTELQN